MKSVIATTFSLLLSCTGAAMAQQTMYEGHMKQLDADKNGTVNRQEYQAFMTQAFDKLDANNDGSLSKAEAGQVLKPDQFATTDANGDGRIGQNEFMDQVMKDFAAADKGGDGHLQ